MAIRVLAVGHDALFPSAHPVPAERVLREPMASALVGRELGVWALGPDTLAYLEALVHTIRPQLVLEFGSGISTAALALSMREAGASGGEPVVVSFEQDEEEATRTEQLLSRLEVADLVAVIFAPLGRRSIEGIETTCYLLPASVRDVIRDRVADLVLIDGPAGEAGARFGTLPLALPFVRQGARFVLDDGLRDSELWTARRWASLPYVDLDGIRLVDKGILTGVINIG